MTTLLVVDHEPAIRVLVSKWVQAQGYTVAEAGSAGEALDRMAQSAAAVALCDVSLPDRDGLWLAGQMRRQFPRNGPGDDDRIRPGRAAGEPRGRRYRVPTETVYSSSN